MSKRTLSFRLICCFISGVLFLLSGGCAAEQRTQMQETQREKLKEEQQETQREEPRERRQETQREELEEEQQETQQEEQLDKTPEPKVTEVDWSAYFDGLNGAAVLYDPAASQYMLYNPELAQTRRSPCSTFKIISSMIALENEILVPEESTRKWSGEVFWNENWNQDIAFQEAFRVSCVWYFREIIDVMGPEMVQEGLELLKYGNCDISDWEGRLNTNNNNRALTGFWIESSLAISPKEQVEVMERIFGKDSVCSEGTRHVLKEAMLVTEPERTAIPIYGKTGMGKMEGIMVDAWFTGFAESEEGNVYFCVYLGRTDDGNGSSAAAKEIAVRIMEDYCK